MTERITAAQFRAEGAAAAAPSKYGNEKCQVHGIDFDSKREANRYILLRQWMRDGKIKDLKCQVPVKLIGKDGCFLRTAKGRVMTYRADFSYIDAVTGRLVLEDAKGFATKEYLVKAAVVRCMGHDLREV